MTTPAGRRARHRRIVRRVRDAIWAMKDPQEMGGLLAEIRAGMIDLDIPLLYCGVNLVDSASEPPSVVSHSMNPVGQWVRLQSKGSQTVLGFWRAGETVYRADLAHDDPYGEHILFPDVGCIVDVPFAQGTLAASSRQPNAFSDDDIELLEDMALLLSDGFRRLAELRALQVRLRVREQVWQMRRPEDIVQVLATLRDSFADLGLRYTACGLNLVREPGAFVTHTMERGTDWTPAPVEGPLPVVERFWREGKVVYRRDLQRHDPFGELQWMEGIFGRPVRCILDVPFSHGTLALNHTEPDAFSDEQVELLCDLARALEEGFRRMDDLEALEQRNRALEHSVEEKTVLLKEIHHRVKNNLQVISSLLSLRGDGIDDPAARRCFDDVRAQVQSMALIHERLYDSPDLARLDFGEYVQTLARNVFASYGVDPDRIGLDLRVTPHSVSVDTAVQCGLIAHELVSNALKHAFPGGRRGTLRIEAEGLNPVLGRLRISDDGIGMPPYDAATATSLGLRLVGDLAQRLHSTIEVSREGGSSFQVHYPVASPTGEE